MPEKQRPDIVFPLLIHIFNGREVSAIAECPVLSNTPLPYWSVYHIMPPRHEDMLTPGRDLTTKAAQTIWGEICYNW